VCARCAQRNPADARFCQRCGTALGADAGGLPRAPERRPPTGAAEPVRAAVPRVEGERKHLTVLFVDVVNSLQLAATVGPEAWHEIIDGFFQLLADGVLRFDGTVNQYTGDGIMALFGAPIAHEDHAQRACHAALSLQARLTEWAARLRAERDIEPAIRMGLNSGEVVFGRIGDELRLEYSAQGHMVGLAARMEQLAAPGRICLTEHTARLVADYFALRDLGSFAVKGVPDPLRVFELGAPLATATRLQASRTRGFSRLVGRADELAALEDSLVLAGAGGGRIVHVVGDAGVGKSRLCHEFLERCRTRGVPVYEAHCVSHGQAVPFQPILQLLVSFLGLADRGAASCARDAIRADLVVRDPALEPALPILFDFLGIADASQPAPRTDPDARQRQLALLLRRIVALRSAERPTVVSIDDVHWIDPASEALLLEVVAAVPGTRTLLILNARPEHRLPAVAPGPGTQITLQPLGTRAAGELIDTLLGADPSLAELRARIGERTAGNPFFIEEAVRSLVEEHALDGKRGSYRLASPAADLAIPVTVQAVLASRIDRLGDRAKEVLRAGAVIGRTFARPVLRHALDLEDRALDECLQALEAATLVHAQPGDGEPEFAFHHPLTQEVAYRTQLGARRVAMHARVAQALDALAPGKRDERAALIAYHWECAREPRHAATWHARAASWPGITSQAESLRHWRKVRQLVRTTAAWPEGATLGLTACVRSMTLGWRLGLDAGEEHALFEEGRALADRVGDSRSLAMLANLYLANLGARMSRTWRSHARRYPESAAEARRLALESDDPGVRLAVCVNRVYSLFFAGKLGPALAILEDTLATTPADHRTATDMYLYSPWLWIKGFRGQLLSYMGRLAEAAAALDDAVRAATLHGELENRGWAEDFWVTQSWAAGDAAAACRHARAAVEIAETTGSAFSRVLAYKALGVAHVLGGAWTEAIESLEPSLGIARDGKANLLEEASVLALLAEAHLGAGDAARARLLADEAVTAARRRGTRMYECQAQLARAAVLVQLDGAGATRVIGLALARAQLLLQETGARAYAPFVHEQRAALARLRGDDERARGELAAARHEFEARGATGHLRRLDDAQGANSPRTPA